MNSWFWDVANGFCIAAASDATDATKQMSQVAAVAITSVVWQSILANQVFVAVVGG